MFYNLIKSKAYYEQKVNFLTVLSPFFVVANKTTTMNMMFLYWFNYIQIPLAETFGLY